DVIERVWGGAAISDSTLNARVSAARRAVGDDGKSQSVIRTYPRRGFRFVAEITETTAPQPEDVDAKTEEPNIHSPLSQQHISSPVVAVLPFDNLSADPDQQYFADGVSEDIITALTKHRWLRVIARNSSFSFRGDAKDVRKIAQALDADYLIEGSVRSLGDRIRISAQLIHGETGAHIWAQKYDCAAMELFSVQDDIIETIAGRIEPELGQYERRRIPKTTPRDLDAWGCYHLALSHFYKFNSDDNAKAQSLFRRCVELDPEFGPAHAWRAYAIILRAVYFEADLTPDMLEEANTAVRRALEIDDQDAVAHFAAGRVLLACREYDGALRELETAIDLNPCLAQAYCGLGDSLAYEGRMSEAIGQFEKAIKLSPHDPFRWAFYSYRSLAHLFLKDFEAAEYWANTAIRVPNSHYWANAHLVVALSYQNRKNATHDALAHLLARKPNFTCERAKNRLFYIKSPDQLSLYIDGLRTAGLPEQ
ncbi:MAG: tetratricopeptide repeat protein, partial [Alphaproteobacteria bacterium]|nr:tetratricopeptide repeat protein [Alphaproteobacteria bacterium]